MRKVLKCLPGLPKTSKLKHSLEGGSYFFFLFGELFDQYLYTDIHRESWSWAWYQIRNIGYKTMNWYNVPRKPQGGKEYSERTMDKV